MGKPNCQNTCFYYKEAFGARLGAEGDQLQQLGTLMDAGDLCGTETPRDYTHCAVLMAARLAVELHAAAGEQPKTPVTQFYTSFFAEHPAPDQPAS